MKRVYIIEYYQTLAKLRSEMIKELCFVLEEKRFELF
jgi:hypothetical protein